MSTHDDDYRNFGDSCSGVYPPDVFEGVLVEFWPNGQPKYRGRFEKNSRRTGQHISFWETGALQEVAFWKGGWVYGTMLRFRKNGSKDSERDYGQDGARTRSWTIRSYDLDSDLSIVKRIEDDTVVSKWVRPDIQELMNLVDVDSIVAAVLKDDPRQT